MDPSGRGNLYNPFYNPPFNSQNGLLQTANQIYPNQVQTPGGQYYVPGLSNQNQGGVNIVPAAGNANAQWPQNGLGSSVYQNSYQYPQQNYFPPNTGYVPVAQNPVQVPVQNVNTNIQTGQPGLSPTQVQQPAVANTKQIVATQVPLAPPTSKAPVLADKSPQVNSDNSKDSNDMDKLTDKVYSGVDSNNNFDDYDYQKPSIPNSRPSNYGRDGPAIQKPVLESNDDRKKGDYSDSVDSPVRGRTYPPSPKTRTQVDTPTQSTVAGQKSVHPASHSEGYPDYSWMSMNYNDPVQRVSGKKGSVTRPSGKQASADSKKQDVENTDTSDKGKQQKQTSLAHGSKTDKQPYLSNTDTSRLKPDDDNTPDYPYDDYRRPSSNRRPYGRYEGRYDNSRQRPNKGSRYPYYDTGYPRGKGRNPYPVWDPYKDEYYYPDTYDERPYGDYGKVNQGNQDVVACSR